MPLNPDLHLANSESIAKISNSLPHPLSPPPPPLLHLNFVGRQTLSNPGVRLPQAADPLCRCRGRERIVIVREPSSTPHVLLLLLFRLPLQFPAVEVVHKQEAIP